MGCRGQRNHRVSCPVCHATLSCGLDSSKPSKPSRRLQVAIHSLSGVVYCNLQPVRLWTFLATRACCCLRACVSRVPLH